MTALDDPIVTRIASRVKSPAQDFSATRHGMIAGEMSDTTDHPSRASTDHPSRASITITIPGKITSANRVTRHVGGRALKSASARRDTERIRAIAWAAAQAAGWEAPEVAAIRIQAHNSRLDAGNIEKVLLDSIKGGLLIVDDRPRHLRRLLIEHHRDEIGERYEITVSRCVGPVR